MPKNIGLKHLLCASILVAASGYGSANLALSQTSTAPSGEASIPVPSDVAENQYKDMDGTVFTGPPTLSKPTKLIQGVPNPKDLNDTGPYYRVLSEPGFSFFSGNIYLPCAAARFRKGETGFIYTGGWGAGVQGAAVDAGFQKSSFQDGSLNDNYALFNRIDQPQQYNVSVRPLRFRCNQTVSIQFGPVDANTLEVKATGRILDGLVRTVKVPVHINPQSGWYSANNDPVDGVFIKRMTTIAQPKGWSHDVPFGTFKNDWDSSGTYFGRSATSDSNLIKWSDMRLGLLQPGGSVKWSAWTDDEYSRLDTFPKGDTSRVKYNDSDKSVELLAIDLHS